MTTRILFFVFFFTIAGALLADPPQTSPFIKIDQFGYLCSSKKVAVISNPQEGYNAEESFSPSNHYEVRRWDNDSVVFSGTPEVWNDSATHEQSGDQGWWFDFSEVTQSGSYYIYDVEKEVGSYRFEVGEDVYNQTLEQAVRTFYYQRSSYDKEEQYAGEWADAAAFDGPNQDRAVTDVNDKGNPATARDLHGGWFDAGDVNKYTTFTFEPLTQMLEAYRLNPTVFEDDYNIPESGNGVADLLDEVKYELDWLMRMQDATGTGGLFQKVGVIDFNDVSPPSQDTRPRYYVGECTSSTITGVAVFALGGLVYRSLPQPALVAYGDSLLARAERAWDRAEVTTENFTQFETSCDSQEIKAGDADRNDQEHKEYLITAAVYLYEATGKAQYREYVEAHYTEVRPINESYWAPYRLGVAFALLNYTTLPEVSSEVASAIISQKAGQTSTFSVDNYQAKTDLYRAFMEDWAHHWGSNMVRANSGSINLDFNTFGINSSDEALYRETAEQYLHWLHGVNPMGMVMLSNMYDYGAEHSANEIYHTWFYNGTKYDNALTSAVGPPPGYVTGGPNKNYPIVTITPPYGQPPQKSYRDWNTQWNGSFGEESFQITEPAIYYQGAYIMLLSRLIPSEQSCLASVEYPESECKAEGSIFYEQWNNLPGTQIADLTADARYPSEPTDTTELFQLVTPYNRSTRQGGRIHGTMCPPQTGYYTFWILSDGNVQLSLSSDDDPDNKEKISSRKFYWVQRTRAVHLEAGRSYYLEVLINGARFTSIGWQLPDHQVEPVISSEYLSPAVDTTQMAPLAPSALTAVALSSSQVNLSWQDEATNEEGFLIERRLQGDSSWITRTTLSVDASGYADTDVLPDTTYYYRMSTYNAVDTSGYSNEAMATTPPAPQADGPLYVYQDALADDWQNWSWLSDIDFGQSAVVYEGDNAMQVTYQEASGGGVSLRSGAVISATNYEAIQMWAHGGDGPDQQLQVLIQTEDGGGVSPAKDITVRAGEWQEVTVLLSELGSPGAIKRITLQNNSGEAPTPFYIDNLRLVDKLTESSARVATGSPARVYPNVLSEGALQLRWDEKPSASQQIEVLNTQGQVIYQATHRGTQWQIDRSHFRYPGIYIVRVHASDADKAESFRILVK